MRKFLTARWQNLVMANYIVRPSLLESRIPKGVLLDTFEGKCFVSLVGFLFCDTRIFGIPVPFHVNFEEVNLRFYVKKEMPDEMRRGVCFVKEIVPRAAISIFAKTIYGEPYETWKMRHQENKKDLTYYWDKGKVKNRLHVEIAESAGIPMENSQEAFIVEHYWGYTQRGENRTDEYKVEHPKWELSQVNYAEIDVDFGKTYGDEFEFLSDLQPDSILMARGSEIVVYQGERFV